nr:uncharacterized protein LOC109184143 [Ipomoea batatas]
MEDIRRRLGFDYLFTVDSVGLSGGLALIWKKELEISILSHSVNHIDTSEKIGGAPQPVWLMQGFQEAIDFSGLMNFNFHGFQYTWEKGREDETGEKCFCEAPSKPQTPPAELLRNLRCPSPPPPLTWRSGGCRRGWRSPAMVIAELSQMAMVTANRWSLRGRRSLGAALDVTDLLVFVIPRAL